MLPKQLAGLALVVSVLFINSFALPFSGDVTGMWKGAISSDVSDIYAYSNEDNPFTADFAWGIPASNSTNNLFMFNGFSFTDVEENTPFSIGDFMYRNGSTYNSVGVDGVTLSIDLDLTDPLSVDDNAFDFAFSIENTPNVSGDPVADGDIVTVMNSFSPATFNYAGVEYTLNLLGFSSDGGANIRTDFSSPENGTQCAALFAQITSDVQQVPEPGIISLLIMGFITLGGVTLSRKKY